MNSGHCDCKIALRPPEKSLDKGFTLIELIVVIVILAVLSIYAAPRMFNSADFSARGFHDETLAYLRFARQSAIAQRRAVCVVFSSNSLTLSIASGSAVNQCDTALRGPKGENPASLGSKSGAAFSGQPGNFNFDALGRPVSTAGALLSTQSIHIIGAAKSVTIETETGFVHE